MAYKGRVIEQKVDGDSIAVFNPKSNPQHIGVIKGVVINTATNTITDKIIRIYNNREIIPLPSQSSAENIIRTTGYGLNAKHMNIPQSFADFVKMHPTEQTLDPVVRAALVQKAADFEERKAEEKSVKLNIADAKIQKRNPVTRGIRNNRSGVRDLS